MTLQVSVDPGVDRVEPGVDLIEAIVEVVEARLNVGEAGVHLGEAGVHLGEAAVYLREAGIHPGRQGIDPRPEVEKGPQLAGGQDPQSGPGDAFHAEATVTPSSDRPDPTCDSPDALVASGLPMPRAERERYPRKRTVTQIRPSSPSAMPTPTWRYRRFNWFLRCGGLSMNASWRTS